MFDKIKNKFAIALQGDKSPNVLLCTCIGDALGMPFEGLASDNKSLTNWDGKKFLPSRPRPPAYYGSTLNVNAGQFTDDGQMSIMVAESLIQNKRFNANDLAARYVDWIYSGRARGYGRTTKAAVDNLKNGTHWSKSGVAGSFGNGTAMRAAPFGVFYANRDFSDMIQAVKTDSAITHASVEAEAGALAVAITTYLTTRNETAQVASFLAVHLPESEVRNKILKAYDMATGDLRKTISSDVALKMLGTGADVRQTVPAAMYCYWKFTNFQTALEAAIRAGRDADTTAAIVGGMIGAKTKLYQVPAHWIETVESSPYLRELDTKLTEK